MPNVKFKNHLHLHFLVFIAGFTAILGELITIQAIPLVWYRMGDIVAGSGSNVPDQGSLAQGDLVLENDAQFVEDVPS